MIFCHNLYQVYQFVFTHIEIIKYVLIFYVWKYSEQYDGNTVEYTSYFVYKRFVN